MKERKRERDRFREKKNRYFCVEHGGVHFVAIIKAGQPPVCLDDVASYQKQTTELKRLKGQGTLHNAKKLKFLCISTYIRPMALPFFFFFYPFPILFARCLRRTGTGRKERRKEKEKRERDQFTDKRKHRMGSNVRAS